MSKKNGAARAHEPAAPVKAVTSADPIPSSFAYRPEAAMNVRVREYLLEHGISFNELCDVALTDYLTRHPSWQRRSLRLPRGKRPKV